MWKIIYYFWGFVDLEIRSPRAAYLLSRLAASKIAVRKIDIVDSTVLKVTIRTADYERTKSMIQKCGSEIIKESCGGFKHDFSFFYKRPAIIIGFTAAILLGVMLPQFVWFYRVEGNETVPTQQILRELRSLGVGFGTFGPSIHPQELKNKMLRKIPKLSWFTIRQSGGTAEIVVRERPDKLPVMDRETPMDLVAVRSGVITKTEIYQGNPLCKAGDSVLSGQTLVSAYKDLEFTTEVSTASAEIYAWTKHKCDVVCPSGFLEKTNSNSKTYAALIVGNRRYSLSFGSSVSCLHCDKTTKKIEFILPGGYSLPICVEITTKTDYDTNKQDCDFTSAKYLLEHTARDYVQSQLIAGTILKQNEVREQDLHHYCYHAALSCEEMIARQVPAKELKDEHHDYGKNN